MPGKIEGEGVRLEADEDVVYQERRRTNVEDDLEEVRKRLRVCYAQRTNFMYIVQHSIGTRSGPEHGVV